MNSKADEPKKLYEQAAQSTDTMATREGAEEAKIRIEGKFKSVNLFNDTIHIILYPKDGLRVAANLQEIDEWTDVTLDLKKEAF